VRLTTCVCVCVCVCVYVCAAHLSLSLPPMATKVPTVLTAKVPYEDMVLYNDGQFSNFSKTEYGAICKRFRVRRPVLTHTHTHICPCIYARKRTQTALSHSAGCRTQSFDQDDSNTLDVYEVQLMMESLGETKTHAGTTALCVCPRVNMSL
jgi:hypothetical protein